MNVARSRRSLRTLVVHSGGIGDFLLCCPTLIRLREDGPVETAGIRSRLLLAEVAGITEGSHDLNDIGFDSVFSEPSPLLAKSLARFDRAIIWMNDDDGAIRRAFNECGVRDVCTFAGLPPKDWAEHAAHYYSRCLGFENLPPLRLPIVPDEEAHDVVIHPGSGGARKNWPLERFEAAAAELGTRGRTVHWYLGPAEDSLPLNGKSSTIQTTSLVTLARILAATHVYVGNDSGVTHLAAACGCHTVAVFGPTDEDVWAPRGEHVRVIRETSWPLVRDILEAVPTQ